MDSSNDNYAYYKSEHHPNPKYQLKRKTIILLRKSSLSSIESKNMNCNPIKSTDECVDKNLIPLAKL